MTVVTAAVSTAGRGPWATAFNRLSRDRVALIALGVFVLIVVSCLLAPVYAHWAGVDPFKSTLDAVITIDGQQKPVMELPTTGLALGYTPIGPTWSPGNYFLGADNQGRDVMARLLYGGMNSILIAAAATTFTLVFATLFGLLAGFFGGVIDMVLSRILDVLWAFPVYLLAISLSIVLLTQGITIGPFVIDSGSLWLPIFIIGLIYIPYVARPVRGQVMALRNSDFVMAAIGLGAPSGRILLKDILPNISTTLIVFVPIMMALNMLTESALSFASVSTSALTSASYTTTSASASNRTAFTVSKSGSPGPAPTSATEPSRSWRPPSPPEWDAVIGPQL